MIVHDDDYGKANLATAQAILRGRKVELVAAERFRRNITDVTAPMLKIRAANPDVILSGAYPAPAVLIAQKYGEYGMTAIPLAAGGAGHPDAVGVRQERRQPRGARELLSRLVVHRCRRRGRISKKYADMYKAALSGPRGRAVHDHVVCRRRWRWRSALEKAGRNLTREVVRRTPWRRWISQPEILAGPLQFGQGPPRRARAAASSSSTTARRRR